MDLNTSMTALRGQSSGFTPHKWQQAAFDSLVGGEIPDLIDAPTGAGKTAMMEIYFLALAQAGAGVLPRRMTWVVNIHSVLDEAHSVAMRLQDRLQVAVGLPSDPLHEVAHALSKMAGSNGKLPLRVLEMRGGAALDRSWPLDPLQPTLVLGSVPMVGSRLLVRGYGAGGKWGAPVQAAMLLQDNLVTVDEPHLCGPFVGMVLDLRDEIAKSATARLIRPFAVMVVGATIPAESLRRLNTSRRIQQLPAASAKGILGTLFRHKKTLRLLGQIKVVELVRAIQNAIKENPGYRVACVLNRVKSAADVAHRLKEAGLEVVTITGAMRPYDRRTAMASDAVKELFLARHYTHPCPRVGVVVGTSAIEAGVDGDVDFLFTEATSLDSLLQRIGRAGRSAFSGRPETQIRAFTLEPADILAPEVRGTLKWLETLKVGGSVDASIGTGVPACARANSHSHELCRLPIMRRKVDDGVFTRLACSSLAYGPGRNRQDLDIEPILSGYEGEGAWCANVAMRAEVDLLNAGVLDLKIVSAVFLGTSDIGAGLPIHPAELARVYLTEAASIGKTSPRPKGSVLLLTSGRASLLDWNRFINTGRGITRDATLVFGTEDVELVSELTFRQIARTVKPDVALEAEAVPRPKLIKRLAWDGEAWTPFAGLSQLRPPDPDTAPPPDAWDPDCMSATGYALVHEQPRQRRRKPTLTTVGDHNKAVALRVGEWCDLLALPADVKQLLVASGAAHDLGKIDPRWHGGTGMAKIEDARSSSVGFRHELASAASLVDKDAKVIVQAHHGYGRPHFPAKVMWNQDDQAKGLAVEGSDRWMTFAEEYGPAQALYLCALLQCADAVASQETEDLPDET